MSLSSPESPSGNQPKRKAGRPKGSLGAVLADLTDQVTLEDFGFIRALVNGIEPDKAFRQYYGYRHFDASGSPTVPHGLSIAAHAKRLNDLIMRSALLSGMRIEGPAIIEEATTTTVVRPSDRLEVDAYGGLHIHINVQEVSA